MYELVQVGPRSYYINAPVKIGVYLAEENQVYLIDSCLLYTSRCV